VLHRCAVLQESLKPRIEEVVIELSRQDLSADQQYALGDMLAFLFMNNLKFERMEEISEPVIAKMLNFAMRLAFINSVQAKLPESLHRLLPEQPGQGAPFELTETYARVKDTVKIKDGSDGEVLDVLLGIEPRAQAFKLFAQALVENGSRTVSHTARLIELYRNVVLRAEELELVAPGEKESILVMTVIEFWINNAFRLEKTCDQFVGAGFVSPNTLVGMMSVDPESLSTYNLIDLVMRAVLSRVTAAKRALAEDSGMQTDELSRSLAESEHNALECIRTLLEKSPESVQHWFARKYRNSVLGVPETL
jgi:hypothetical protein